MAKKITVAYTNDVGKKWKCRISEATHAAQPTAPPVTGFDVPAFAKVGGSRRSYGMHVRYLNIYQKKGEAPDDYIIRDRFPVMLLADVATLITAGQVTIDGVTWKISTATSEKEY